MNLDSDMQAVIDQLKKFNPPPIETLTPNNARNAPTLKNAVEEMASNSATTRAMNVAMPAMPEPVGKIENILIPTPEGELLARVYSPDADADAALPVVVYFHGGGWVIADLNVYEPSCRALCNSVEAIVVSVAYRQSPEAKYPAAVNDAYAATQWIIQNAAQIGGDPVRVAIAGESAGGNLATVTCLKTRDEGGQMPIAQLLVYPVTDTSMSQPSYAENENSAPLKTAMMPWFWKYYLENDAQKSEKYVAPLQADDLSGLPPAIIITAEFDPLHDEGLQYAEKLAAAGVSVASQHYDGVTHEFFGLAGAVSKAKQALDFATDGLKKVFDSAEKSRTA